MKRLFCVLLLCFVNVPASLSDGKNALVPAFHSRSPFLFLSISQAFLPISTSPFFPILSLSASLFNSCGSQSRTDSMLGEQNRVRCQWNRASTFSPLVSLSFFCFSLPNQTAHLLFSSFWTGVSCRHRNIYSPLFPFSSPQDPLQHQGMIYDPHGHSQRQVAC